MRRSNNSFKTYTVWILAAAGFVFIAAKLYEKIAKKISEMALNKNVKAFLAMIRKCEGTSGVNGYKMLFGGKLFQDFSKHPNVRVPFRDTYSTAAGAYQFLHRTWTPIALRLGLLDFSPESQDKAAIELISEKNALNDIANGKFDVAINKVRKVWASLPGAGYNQPEKTLATAKQYYTSAGGTIA